MKSLCVLVATLVILCLGGSVAEDDVFGIYLLRYDGFTEMDGDQWRAHGHGDFKLRENELKHRGSDGSVLTTIRTTLNRPLDPFRLPQSRTATGSIRSLDFDTGRVSRGDMRFQFTIYEDDDDRIWLSGSYEVDWTGGPHRGAYSWGVMDGKLQE